MSQDDDSKLEEGLADSIALLLEDMELKIRDDVEKDISSINDEISSIRTLLFVLMTIIKRRGVEQEEVKEIISSYMTDEKYKTTLSHSARQKLQSFKY